MIRLFLNNVKSRLLENGSFRKLKAMFETGSFPVNVYGTEPGFRPFLLSALLSDYGSAALVVLPTEQEAKDFHADLSLSLQQRAIHFPAWQTLPYSDIDSPASVHMSRALCLQTLLLQKNSIAVTSLRALLTVLPPVSYTQSRLLRFVKQQSIKVRQLEKQLALFGYERVPRVSIPGEFTVRGEVIDIYPAGLSQPIRILMDFDCIESIRSFDTITQLSGDPVNSVVISPLCEFAIPQKDADVLYGKDHGIEYMLPNYYTIPASIPEYLPAHATVFCIDPERLMQQAEILTREYKTRYKMSSDMKQYLALPEKALFSYETMSASFTRAMYFPMHKEESGAGNGVRFLCDPSRSFFGNLGYFTGEMQQLCKLGYSVYVFADYETQAERLRHIVKDIDVTVIPASISQGFGLPEVKLIVLHENEIFRRKKYVARNLQKIKTDKIDSFVDLEEGDFIVHFQHGIGRYCGMERMTAAGNERDYMNLEYAEGEHLFLPIEQVNLVERYVTPGSRLPRLDRLGGKSWSARRAKVKKAVEEIAEQLLHLYSLRKKMQGFAFAKDSEWQEQFEAGFPFEETPDQLTCIEAVKKDMELPAPMDRLICGDVGYGKTEIALRAAFKAVMNGKQVALLAPTTILVEQHYENFCDRFENFPVSIAMLSRFVAKTEQKKTVQKLQHEGIDIVIGTHRLVQKDIAFKNLGLLIIDEEQRFGVKHKEKIKELKATVDCLTLSATPIPRTLYMSLVKIRDMSVLATPPQNRLPIETFVMEFNEDIVAKAISLEIERGGQVFFLHNRIESIEKIHLMLNKLFPHLRVAVAHGKLEGEELEDIMHDFIRGNYHVLLSTAIIENGIDIPNVNTIIIDRADMFGISQLYQLRGRVGRSDIPAYAYLLYPDRRALSERAMKRLKIISDHTELGSGFKIAMKDLEIRGAGNILGAQQHGDILAVGFDMYVKLLHEAIREIEGDADESRIDELYLELEYSGYIPDTYISEPIEKIETYKQIASITTEEEFDSIFRNIEDRFGPMPDELQSILSIAELRILCRTLGIKSLREKQGTARIEFSRVSAINADKVIRLIKEKAGKVYLKSNEPACIFLKTGTIGLKEKSLFIKEQLSFML
ncbi:MAG: transcription-repair coupling factor [Spirochaetales bacterium]|nr:transcription-repair coupling factor [Spirochaetales bacterium]